MNPNRLHCEMTTDCPEAVSYLDEKGFIYCTDHGKDRQYSHRCRKLQPHELRHLEAGHVLEKY